MHSFLGCMRNIFINDVSVLWELNQKNKTTRYLGPTVETPFVDTCNDVSVDVGVRCRGGVSVGESAWVSVTFFSLYNPIKHSPNSSFVSVTR